MTQTTAASAAEIRAAIGFESEYVVHARDGGTWTRPEAAEHRTLHGIDVWHAVRRSRHYCADVHLFEHGVLTLASATAALRFIPEATYQEYFCSSEECEDSTADGEGWEGLCGNCADRAYAAECAGQDEETTEDAGRAAVSPLPAGPALLPAPAAAPCSHGDIRRAAAVHRTLLSALDGPSGVSTVLRDRPIPSAAGTGTVRTWRSLGEEESAAAYGAVRRLITDAPDLAEWAVHMAADRLVPDAEPLTRWQDDEAAVRVHLSFADHVTADQRAAIHGALRLALRTAL
ncbi:hypothetical protein [Streptomyces bacillaris]|uniref:hypothetical protein n=1 Tax=Streptomyces bacillaris TaxID=68179 RepID=UPI0037F5EBDA